MYCFPIHIEIIKNNCTKRNRNILIPTPKYTANYIIPYHACCVMTELMKNRLELVLIKYNQKQQIIRKYAIDKIPLFKEKKIGNLNSSFLQISSHISKYPRKNYKYGDAGVIRFVWLSKILRQGIDYYLKD